ncbi:MAG: SIS domain-containing protein [Candidatus Latescibacteria bacterium]|nr:SIS domain-containing protein [Candidatus Latescibacterota bacterium]
MEMITPKQYLDRFCQAAAGVDPAQAEDLVRLLENAYRQQKAIYIFGNGGSGANASHFCEDLGKGTLKGPSQTGRFRVMSLTDNTPYILAWANDEGFETIFEQQLRNFAQPEEVAIGISASGNSPNVLEAIAFANPIGMHTVGFTGFDGGRLKSMAKYPLHVPSDDMGIVESVHQLLLHYIVSVLRNRI